MSPSTRKRILLGAVLSLIIGLLAVWVASHLKWVEESRRGGYKEEALRNPYHAGMLLMQAIGYNAQRLQKPEEALQLSPKSSLLLAAPENWQTLDRRNALVAWVNRGGHLILNIETADSPQSLQTALGIHSAATFSLRLDDEEEDDALPTGTDDDLLTLTEFGTPLSLRIEGAATRVDMHYPTGFRVRSKPVWATQIRGNLHSPANNSAPAAGEDNSDADQPGEYFYQAVGGSEHRALYARYPLGQGWVTVGNLLPLRNTEIEKADHARLFVRLVSLPHDKRPLRVLPPSRSQTLIDWLVEQAGPALLAALLLALLLLWRVMPRFGPLQPDAVPARPGLLPHLAAVGDFLLREQAFEALIAPLRQQVTRRLMRLRGHHPELDSLAELGARLCGQPVASIERALNQPLANKQDFLACSRSLAGLLEATRHLTGHLTSPQSQTPHSPSGNLP